LRGGEAENFFASVRKNESRVVSEKEYKCDISIFYKVKEKNKRNFKTLNGGAEARES
jgi:hypothetical protein